MITITLPPDLETPLAEEARKRSISLEELAIESLRLLFGRQSQEEPQSGQTMLEYLKDYIGVVKGRPGNWSEKTGIQFGDYVDEKYRKGKL